jgi:hypothetical protein
MGMVAFGQHSFEFTYQTTDDEELFDGIQDSEGNFVLCGLIGNYMQDYNPLVVKIFPEGNYISRRFISTYTLGYFNLVTQTPDGNYLFFGVYSTSDFRINNYLWVVKTDADLNTIFEKSFYIEDSLYQDCFLNSLYCDTDSTCVVAGIRRFKDPVTNFSDLWMIKFNIEGDTLMTKSPQHISWTSQWAQELTTIPATGEYMVIGGRFDSSTSDVELFRMDSLFNKTGFTNVPKQSPNKYIRGIEASSDIWLNDTVFLLSTKAKDTIGKRVDDCSLGVFAVDTAGTILKQLIVGKPDTSDYPAYQTSMATVNDTTIYIGGYVSHLDFFPEQPSFIELYLIDTALNLRGYVQYGGDAMYWLNGIIPASDGGCLLYAMRYDYQVNSYERDVHIIKMQREDMELITKIFSSNDNSEKGIAFPNPAHEQLNIPLQNFSGGTGRIVIYSIDGRKIFDKRMEFSGNQIFIDTNPLPEGMYIFEVRQNSQVLQSGKFLKSSF